MRVRFKVEGTSQGIRNGVGRMELHGCKLYWWMEAIEDLKMNKMGVGLRVARKGLKSRVNGSQCVINILRDSTYLMFRIMVL